MKKNNNEKNNNRSNNIYNVWFCNWWFLRLSTQRHHERPLHSFGFVKTKIRPRLHILNIALNINSMNSLFLKKFIDRSLWHLINFWWIILSLRRTAWYDEVIWTIKETTFRPLLIMYVWWFVSTKFRFRSWTGYK